MIYQDIQITVNQGLAVPDKSLYIFRGDSNIILNFKLVTPQYMLTKDNKDNLVTRFGVDNFELRLQLEKGYDKIIRGVITEDGCCRTQLTQNVMQALKTGTYSYQITLIDDDANAIMTFPACKAKLNILDRMSLTAEELAVPRGLSGEAMADLSVIVESDDKVEAFDSNGNYIKTNWKPGDVISSAKLNKIEEGIDEVNKKAEQLDANKAEQADLNLQKTRIDNIVSLPAGSTTGDAELIDARIEYNGVVNATVGGAIRNQISNIRDTLDVIMNKANLYSTAPLVEGKYYMNGTEQNGPHYAYFKVEVKSGVTYYMYPKIRLYSLEDYNGNRIAQANESADTKEMYSYTPNHSGYLYVTIYRSDLNDAKMATTSDMDSVGNYSEVFTLSDKISISEHRHVKDIYEHIDSFFISNNLLDDAQYYPGYFHRESNIVANSNYAYFEVALEPGAEYVVYPRCRMIDWYDNLGKYVSFDESMDGQMGNVIITVPDNSSRACINVYMSDIPEIRLYKNDGRTTADVNAFGTIKLNENVSITDNDSIMDINDKIKDLQSNVVNNNLIPPSEIVDGYYFNSYSTILPGSQYFYCKVNLKNSVTYHMYPRIRIIRVYDKHNKSIYFNDNTCNNGKPFTYTPPFDCEAYVTFYLNDKHKAFISEESDSNLVTAPGQRKLAEDIEITGNGVIISNNLLTSATKHQNAYFMQQDNIISSEQYSYYELILKAGETYYMYPRIRILSIYSMEGTLIKADNNSVATGKQYEFTPEQDVKAYVTYYNDDKKHTLSTIENASMVSPVGYKMLNPNIVVESAVNAVDMDTANQGNILYKKKWAVIGDSFTAGDFGGYTDANGLTGKDSPEVYDAELGMYKTYPWWIMKRNNMTLQKFYQGGRTLATPADGTFTNSITYNNMYKQIDADVDYITIYLGINDGHHMPGTTGDDGEDTSGAIPIGTETDETTATFYGAWNVLLRDLITLYPFAHIGILVSNGMDTDEHVNATIKMAKKWGIPYLNLDSGYDVPLLIRSRPNCRPETCAEAIALRRNQQRVSSSNGHPNHLAHKYESTFIEAFLRRI